MKIKVLVCNADGSQYVEEREVPDGYLTPAEPEAQEEAPQQ